MKKWKSWIFKNSRLKSKVVVLGPRIVGSRECWWVVRAGQPDKGQGSPFWLWQSLYPHWASLYEFFFFFNKSSAGLISLRPTGSESMHIHPPSQDLLLPRLGQFTETCWWYWQQTTKECAVQKKKKIVFLKNCFGGCATLRKGNTNLAWKDLKIKVEIKINSQIGRKQPL